MKLWYRTAPRRSYADILFAVSLWAGGMVVVVGTCALYAGHLIFLTGKGADAPSHGRLVSEIERKGAACRAELLAYERFLEIQRVGDCKVERLRGLFEVLADSLPKGVWISTVETHDRRVSIKGYAFLDQGISDFSEALRARGYGEEVVVEASKSASSETEHQRAFVISLKFRPSNDCVTKGAS